MLNLNMKLQEGHVFTGVCLFPCEHYLDASDLIVQSPSLSFPGHQTWDPSPGPSPPDIRPVTLMALALVVTSGDHHWRPVQTSSFVDTLLAVVIEEFTVSASGSYAPF